jgi:putative oxidoreductase
MNLLRSLQQQDVSAGISWALLALRLVAGLAFVLHGWSKIKDPFRWMGPGTPAVFQALAAVAEVGGGFAWMLGLLTPLASAGIASTMVVAVARHVLVKRDPFLGGYELATVYLCISLLLLACGPGRFSLDHLVGTAVMRTKA